MFSRMCLCLFAVGVLFALSACGDFAKRCVCTLRANLNNAGNCVEDPIPLMPAEGPVTNFPDVAHPSYPGTNAVMAGRFGGMAGKPPILINEVVLLDAQLGAAAQKVELWNPSQIDVDAGGFELAWGLSRATLPEGLVLAAGSTLIVHLAVAGTNDSNNVYIASSGELGVTEGELAMVSRAGSIIDYVAWGAAGQSLEDYATTEGEWNLGDFTAAPGVGRSLAYTGSGGSTAADYSIASPSIGSPN